MVFVFRADSRVRSCTASRDLLYLIGLLLRGDRAGAALVLAVTLLIPLGDLAILLAVRGAAAGWHLAPHGASAAAVAAAWRLLRPG